MSGATDTFGGRWLRTIFIVVASNACQQQKKFAEQVFSRAGQRSEANLDPDALADMVSIMVNNLAYKSSLKNVMDKYYEMFCGKDQANKKDFFNCPDSPNHSDQKSDADG